jgi:hypothetical protein
MIHSIRRTLIPMLLLSVAAGAHAQFYKNGNLMKGGSISAGYSGQFTTQLTSNPSSFNTNISTPSGGVLNENVSGQQQRTPDTGGVLISVQMHPVAWAGVEVNYGYFRSTEVYSFNYSSASAAQSKRVPVTTNEATAAYEFHPKHIPLQPFVNVGGGAISFIPQSASNQWRATGLVEVGLDIPMHVQHLALRVEGRSLIYRAPNFNQPVLSTRSWRITDEPVASLVYRF